MNEAETILPPPRYPEGKGLEAAQRVAAWHLGDTRWAWVLIEAYLNPEAALVRLREERA